MPLPALEVILVYIKQKNCAMISRQIYYGSLATMRLKLAETLNRVKLKDILYRAARQLGISTAIGPILKRGISGLGMMIILMTAPVLWFGEMMIFQILNRILQIHMMVRIIMPIGMIICSRRTKAPMPIMLAMM